MPKFTGLVRNEMQKIIMKKRFLVTVLVSSVLIIMMTIVGHYNQKQVSSDWKQSAISQIHQNEQYLTNNNKSDGIKKRIQLQNQELQYHVDHNIPINENTAVNLVMDWTQNNFISTFIPLLITIIASDIVSAELTEGTIKLLLIRPARRWKILASKFAALQVFILILFGFFIIVSYIVFGSFITFGDWGQPVMLGLQQGADQLNFNNVHIVPAWEASLMFYGLAYISALCFSTIPFLVSVLFRSSATSMGITMAGLIGGSIVAELAAYWKPLKYFFMGHLDLTSHLLGTFQLDSNMGMMTSIWILLIWAALALAGAFTVFTKRDMNA